MHRTVIPMETDDNGDPLGMECPDCGKLIPYEDFRDRCMKCWDPSDTSNSPDGSENGGDAE